MNYAGEARLDSGDGKEEGWGGGRLGTKRTRVKLQGVQLLLVTCPQKQLRAQVRERGGKRSAGGHRW